MKRDLGTANVFTRKRIELLDLAAAKGITLPATLRDWSDFRNVNKTKEQHLAEFEAYIKNNS